MEQKNNSGALFKNNKTKEGQPDYTGTIVIDGKDFRLSAWVNKSKSGQSYMRLLANENTSKPIENGSYQQTIPPVTGTANDGNDDLPF